jgi:hypothetical protein
MLSGWDKPESAARDKKGSLSLLARSTVPSREAMVVAGPHCPRQSGEAVLLSFIEALVERSGGSSEALERVAASD